MSMRKPLSSAFIHAEGRAQRRIEPGFIPSPHGGEEDYVISRELEAERKTKAVAERLEALRSLLTRGLADRARQAGADRPPTVDDLPEALRAGPPPDHRDFELGRPPLLGAVLPKFGHREASPSGPEERAFHQALANWDEAKRRENEELAGLRASTAERAASRARHIADLEAGGPELLEQALRTTMDGLLLPFERPRPLDLVIEPASRSVRIDAWTPSLEETIPQTARYRFAKGRDAVVAVAFDEDKRRPLYRRVLAQVALLILDAAFADTPANVLDLIDLRLHAEGIDPATGQMAHTELLHVEARREAFAALDLTRVDPIPCVQRLAGGAAFPRPGPDA